LSADYKAQELWDARFNCPILNDISRVKSINAKILTNDDLDNLELDVFINIATPRTEEIVHLQETARILKTFRRSRFAHTLLPSSHHATCRLFLYSDKLPSLLTLLEDRINYGIFPDAYAMNLIFDEFLQRDQLSSAARVAALMMFQDEFGLNSISDCFALYSTLRYVEAKTDFVDWATEDVSTDQIFSSTSETDASNTENKSTTDESTTGQNDDDDEDDEDEDDAEYLRIPFLRNPYFDNHFDLKNPRLICGKTLNMLVTSCLESTGNSTELSSHCRLLGSILQGDWKAAQSVIDRLVQSKMSADNTTKELYHHLISNLHEITAPDEKERSSLLSSLDNLTSNSGPTLSERVTGEFANFGSQEGNDIKWLSNSLKFWSDTRHDVIRNIDLLESKKKLVQEIKAKKEELRQREQYLFFYDRLKERRLTRMDYD